MQEPEQPQPYEPPLVTDVDALWMVTEGQYSRSISDDGDAGGYWEK